MNIFHHKVHSEEVRWYVGTLTARKTKRKAAAPMNVCPTVTVEMKKKK